MTVPEETGRHLAGRGSAEAGLAVHHNGRRELSALQGR